MEKPILFNTEMVQAILKGRKTCTRRVIKKKYENADIEWFENKYGRRLVYLQNDAKVIKNKDGSERRQLRAMEEIKKPYEVGDIIYVRETWMISNPFGDFAKDNRTAEYMYKAGYAKGKRIAITREMEKNLGAWKPSIHMPKVAARIFLKVTGVKIERLQDITEEQAIKEGCTGIECKKIHNYELDECCGYCNNSGYIEPPQLQFLYLWNSTVKREQLKTYGWDANPHVWVIDFEVIKK